MEENLFDKIIIIIGSLIIRSGLAVSSTGDISYQYLLFVFMFYIGPYD